jgi:riboflavin synthase
MFTGIIEEIGIVKDVGPDRLAIRTGEVLEDMKSGDSIAVNGVCLTVTTIEGDSLSVDIMPETIRRTNIGRLRYGDKVNIERAMLAGGRFGGHFVQGHVDDVGKVISTKPEKEAVIVRISVPAELKRYIVDKGFIAVDGVSLTVIEHDDFSFTISLVTYTRMHTTLGTRRPGGVVNLEVDIIAKYVERLSRGDSQGAIIDFLNEKDFIKTR